MAMLDCSRPQLSAVPNHFDLPVKRSKIQDHQFVPGNSRTFSVEPRVTYINERYGKELSLKIDYIEPCKKFCVPVAGKNYTLRVTVRPDPDSAILFHQQYEKIQLIGFMYSSERETVSFELKRSKHEESRKAEEKTVEIEFEHRVQWKSSRREIQYIGFHVQIGDEVHEVFQALTFKTLSRDGEENKARSVRDLQWFFYREPVRLADSVEEYMNLRYITVLIQELARIRCGTKEQRYQSNIFSDEEVQTLVHRIVDSCDLGVVQSAKNSQSVSNRPHLLDYLGESYLSHDGFLRVWEELNVIMSTVQKFKEFFTGGAVHCVTSERETAMLEGSYGVGMFSLGDNGRLNFSYTRENSSIIDRACINKADPTFIITQTIFPSRVGRMMLKRNITVDVGWFIMTFCRGDGEFYTNGQYTNRLAEQGRLLLSDLESQSYSSLVSSPSVSSFEDLAEPPCSESSHCPDLPRVPVVAQESDRTAEKVKQMENLVWKILYGRKLVPKSSCSDTCTLAGKLDALSANLQQILNVDHLSSSLLGSEAPSASSSLPSEPPSFAPLGTLPDFDHQGPDWHFH